MKHCVAQLQSKKAYLMLCASALAICVYKCIIVVPARVYSYNSISLANTCANFWKKNCMSREYCIILLVRLHNPLQER